MLKKDIISLISGILGLIVAIITIAANAPALVGYFSDGKISILDLDTRDHGLQSMISEDIKVVFQGEEIETLFSSSVTIKNTTGKVIRPEDFYSPIKMVVVNNAELLHVEVFENGQSEKTVAKLSSKKTAEFKGKLLNPNDSLRVVIYSTKEPAMFFFESKIVNVSGFRFEKEGLDWFECFTWVTTSVIFIFVSGFFSAFAGNLFKYRILSVIVIPAGVGTSLGAVSGEMLIVTGMTDYRILALIIMAVIFISSFLYGKSKRLSLANS